MRIKYQLRGLGIGIVLAALLMGLSAGAKEETLLSDLPETASMEQSKESEPTSTEKPQSEVQSEEQSEVQSEVQTESLTEEKQEELQIAEKEKQEALEKAEKEKQETKQQVMEEGNMSTSESEETEVERIAVVTIAGGDGSGTVSKKLKDVGLIQDAAAYDKYLCKNGYDKKIRTGMYEIPFGATEEEIAKKISSK